jgi:hypothetical protein
MAFPSILLSFSLFAFTFASPQAPKNSTVVDFNIRDQNDGWCAPPEMQGDCAAVQDCANYLRNKGDTGCVTGDKDNMSAFCESGNMKIFGFVSHGEGFSNAPCRDVAQSVQWVVDNCNNNGKCGGKRIQP